MICAGVYLMHLYEEFRDNTAVRYLRHVMDRKTFNEYVQLLQRGTPRIQWSVKCYHYSGARPQGGVGRDLREKIETWAATKTYIPDAMHDATFTLEQKVS